MKSWNHYLPVLVPVPYWIFLVILHLQNLTRCWTDSNRDLPRLCVKLLRPLTPLGLKVTPVLEKGKSLQRGLTAWRRLGRLTNWHASSWSSQQIPWPSLVTFTASSFNVMCCCWLMAPLKFRGTTKRKKFCHGPPLTFGGTWVEGAGFQRKIRARGGSWASTSQNSYSTLCEAWSGVSLFARIWLRMNVVWFRCSCPFWPKCHLCQKFCGWVGAVSSWSNCGRSSPQQPAVKTMKFAGLALKMWLVSETVPYKICIGSGKNVSVPNFNRWFLSLVVFAGWSFFSLIILRVLEWASYLAIGVKMSEYGTVP